MMILPFNKNEWDDTAIHSNLQIYDVGSREGIYFIHPPPQKNFFMMISDTISTSSL